MTSVPTRLLSLQQFCLDPRHLICAKLIQSDCETLLDALQFVWKLPYGRNSSRSDYTLVLSENKGSCSTKHALLSALRTNPINPLTLNLGFFVMDGENTPQVQHVLQEYKLKGILEAHCYLKLQDDIIDITFPECSPGENSLKIIDEIKIMPQQIGTFKVDRHKERLKNWGFKNLIDLSPSELWGIREKCIMALSDPTNP